MTRVFSGDITGLVRFLNVSTNSLSKPFFKKLILIFNAHSLKTSKIKVQIFWEGYKILKKIFQVFLFYQYNGRFFSYFVAFSEYLNFRPTYKLWTFTKKEVKFKSQRTVILYQNIYSRSEEHCTMISSKKTYQPWPDLYILFSPVFLPSSTNTALWWWLY